MIEESRGQTEKGNATAWSLCLLKPCLNEVGWLCFSMLRGCAEALIRELWRVDIGLGERDA
jgi:hypothetical protein